MLFSSLLRESIIVWKLVQILGLIFLSFLLPLPLHLPYVILLYRHCSKLGKDNAVVSDNKPANEATSWPVQQVLLPLIKLHDKQLINDKYCAYYWKRAEDKKLLSS